MEYNQAVDVYNKSIQAIETAIQRLFTIVGGDVFGNFNNIILISAVIYIALMGYALMSGWITMSMREAATRFAKVTLVLILTQFFQEAGSIYDAVWSIPHGIGNFIVRAFDPSASSTASPFVEAINQQAAQASALAKDYMESNSNASDNQTLMVWLLAMSPVLVLMVTIMIAKIISAVLFVVAPIIFIMALIGFQNNFLMSWVKGILLVMLTVVLAYILGGVMLNVIFDIMEPITSQTYTTTTPLTYASLFQIGLMCIVAIVLIGQATTLAGAIIGVAGVNTQQATGFMQIGALQGAGRAAKAGG